MEQWRQQAGQTEQYLSELDKVRVELGQEILRLQEAGQPIPPDLASTFDEVAAEYDKHKARLADLTEYTLGERADDAQRMFRKGVGHGVLTSTETAARGLFDLAQVLPDYLVGAPARAAFDAVTGRNPDKGVLSYYEDAIARPELASRDNKSARLVETWNPENLAAQRPDAFTSKFAGVLGEAVGGLGVQGGVAAALPRQAARSAAGRYALDAVTSPAGMRQAAVAEGAAALGSTGAQELADNAGAGPLGSAAAALLGGSAASIGAGTAAEVGRRMLTSSGFDPQVASNVRGAFERSGEVYGHQVPYSLGVSGDNAAASLEATALDNALGRFVNRDIGERQTQAVGAIVDDIASDMASSHGPVRHGAGAVGRSMKDMLTDAQTELGRHTSQLANDRQRLAGGARAVIPVSRTLVHGETLLRRLGHSAGADVARERLSDLAKDIVPRDRAAANKLARINQMRSAAQAQMASAPVEAKSLRQQASRQLAQADKLYSDMIRNGELGVPYEVFESHRKRVGGATAAGNSLNAGEAKYLYRGLSQDMRAAVRANGGPGAVAELEHIKRVEARIYNKAGPGSKGVMSIAEGQDKAQLEALLRRADEGTLYGWVMGHGARDTDMYSKLEFLRRVLSRGDGGPGRWDNMRATIFANLGADTPRNQRAGGDFDSGVSFNPSTFRANWNKLEPQAQALLAGSAEAAGDLDDNLIRMIDALAIRQQHSNTSRSATHAGNMGVLAVGSGATSLGKDGVVAATMKGLTKVTLTVLATMGLLNTPGPINIVSGRSPGLPERVARRGGALAATTGSAAGQSAAEQQPEDGTQ